MINNGYIWWAILALYIVLTIISASKAYRKGGWKSLKYNLKSTYNYLAYFANYILGLFFVIISLIPVTAITNWINQQMPRVTLNNRWVYHFIPTSYIIIVIIVFCWIMFKGLIPQLKYNDEEKILEKQSKERFRAKLNKWLHIKEKTNANTKTS